MRQVSTRLRHAYKLRLCADYDPFQTVDGATARRCLGYAWSVLKAPEVVA